MNNEYSSIRGTNLRNDRQRNKSNSSWSNDTSVLSVALTAVSVAGVVNSSKPKAKTKPTLMSVESDVGLKRLAELKFMVSKSQSKTPKDGNCMFHCISDQSHFRVTLK